MHTVLLGRLILWGLPAVLLSTHAIAQDVQVLRNEVSHEKGMYSFDFDVRVRAAKPRVWRLMTDYNHLDRLSKLIVASHILRTRSEHHHRVHMALQACIWVFCKDMTKEVEVAQLDDSDILITTDPEPSDFSYSVERWSFSAEQAWTRARYRADMKPKFFVPPVIGPWVIKRFMQKEIEEAARKLVELTGP